MIRCFDHGIPNCPHTVCRADLNQRMTYIEEATMSICTAHGRRDCRDTGCTAVQMRREPAVDCGSGS